MSEEQDQDQDQDLNRWLNELAGSSHSKGSEASQIRKAILREDQDIQAKIDQAAISDQHAIEQLVFRLRREGLVKQSLLTRIRLPLALAATVLVGVTIVQMLPQQEGYDTTVYEEPLKMRGIINEIHIHSETPGKTARDLAEELKKLGLAPTIYRDAAAYYVDFDYQDKNDSLEKKLSTEGVEVKSGYNRIVVSKGQG